MAESFIILRLYYRLSRLYFLHYYMFLVAFDLTRPRTSLFTSTLVPAPVNLLLCWNPVGAALRGTLEESSVIPSIPVIFARTVEPR